MCKDTIEIVIYPYLCRFFFVCTLNANIKCLRLLPFCMQYLLNKRFSDNK